MKYKKKLIEVALPLEAINVASAREKSIRHGHPSTFHLWWARRPLAAARAVIFSQMVDDPSTYVETLRLDSKILRKAEFLFKLRTKVWEEAFALSKSTEGTSLCVAEPGPSPSLDEALADVERDRLFDIIKELVTWKNTNNKAVLQAAQDEIWKSWRRTCAENADHPKAKHLFQRGVLPGFHDPFAGGGALPLEAQRLGLESYATDLNPVAVLINKAMIEIPPKFSDRSPINPRAQFEKAQMDKNWKGAKGLAEDVTYYGEWVSEEAKKKIGHLYPLYEITSDVIQERPELTKYLGQKLTIMAFFWARTVKSPNPAFGDIDVPLASTFMLSTNAGKEAYIEPLIDQSGYHFTIKLGKPISGEVKNGTKLSRGANFRCLMSGTPIEPQYIKNEGKARRMGSRLMAIVAEGNRERVYLPPTPELESIALSVKEEWKPENSLPEDMRSHWTPPYGLETYGDLFTSRQLVALSTFSDLINAVRDQVKTDAVNAGFPDDVVSLSNGGVGATAYADAVGVYLSFGLSKCVDYWNSICTWAPHGEYMSHLFTRQAIPMAWDYAEANPFSSTSGNWLGMLVWVVRVIEKIDPNSKGFAFQQDAQNQKISQDRVVSTDPPYYDNIGYADLSDFFYVWLRRTLRLNFPELFSTVAVPKLEELVATPYRHGTKAKAENFFLKGMTEAMHRLAEQAHPAFPVTIYYAFKQAESDNAEGTINTGWDTFLAAVIQAGFAISGTWPMRTELSNRMIGSGTNALASSIVLVCRKRPKNAPSATRRDFLTALKNELPKALFHLQAGNIAPVDLAQAAIGPGMAVYTRFSRVLDADGHEIPVRAALALINQTLDEALAEQEGDFDADTRWALTWFEQVGFSEGEFGVATVLAQAKATGMDRLVQAGIIVSGKGKVRLLQPFELPNEWNAKGDKRITVWEIVHQLIRAIEVGGEGAAATLVATLGAKAETARELCYRLYVLCERKKRAGEAMVYNGLVQSWPEITRLAREKPATVKVGTTDMFEQE